MSKKRLPRTGHSQSWPEAWRQTRAALPVEAAEDPVDDLATAAEQARASNHGGGNANNDQPAWTLFDMPPMYDAYRIMPMPAGYRTAEVCDAILRSAKSGRREGVQSRADTPTRARRRVTAGSR